MTKLPVSFLSEQSLESANKTFKDDRLHHARKTSRLDTITDQFHRQSERSDLMVAMAIQEQRRRNQKKPELPADALLLLLHPSDGVYEADDDDIDDDVEVPAAAEEEEWF